VPQDRISEVKAPDARTVAISWTAPYPNAGALGPDSLDPLPRHILEEPLAALAPDGSTREGFLNLPFWSTEYVGAGPYKLENWQQGVALEGSAFDGHALGRPKIDRLIERIMRDENTIMANVLAGELDFATRTTLRFNHGETLEQEWASAGKGRLLMDDTAPLAPLIQFRPEYQKTPALLDVRVRKAMAHGIDKSGILDALYNGKGSSADTSLSRAEPYYAELDRVIAKYPFDARRTEQYMNEAGFTKDRDGLFADARGERFRPDYQVLVSVDYERVQLVVADSWRNAGIDVQTNVLPHELVRDDQARQIFTGMSMPGSGAVNERSQLPYLASTSIGRPSNRWKGSNRGGWSNPEYDRLLDAYNATLARPERTQQVIQMMKILSEEIPAFPLYYNIYVLAAVANLQGPDSGVPDKSDYWNVHLWELK
jgi:peptide/nickel transport system substrate-binding protein